jgi:hypothetical protein
MTECKLLYAQRYGQSSLLKRSALEFIAEEMLAAKTAQGDEQSQQGAGEPDQAAPTSCPVAPGGRPIVTSPSDSPLEFLYAQLSFAPDGTADRGQLSSGLQRLGAPKIPNLSPYLERLQCLLYVTSKQ